MHAATLMPDIDRYNHAVRNCLKQCLGSKVPLARLAEFRDHLRELPGWHNRDIAAVETAARQMLRALLKSGA